MTTLSILIAARALIDEPGKWASCMDEWSNGRHCMSTAISVSARTHGADDAARKALGFIPGDFTGMWAWNDAETTTHADVMAKFDAAIAKEEQRS